MDEVNPESPQSGLFGALRRYRRALFIIGLVWFTGVLSAGIFISGIEPYGGLHVFGSARWIAGEPAQMRVALRDLRARRNRPLSTVQVTFEDATGLAGPTQTISEVAGPFTQGSIVAPARPGPWTVILDADAPEGPVTARFSLTVEETVAPASEAWPPPPKPKIPMQPDRGPIRFDIRPLDAVMPAGLPSRLVITTRDANGPVSTPITLKTTEGRSNRPLPKRVTTNAEGVAFVPVEPMHPIFTFELAAAESWAVRRVEHTNTQFTVLTPSSMVGAGALPLVIKSLHGQGTVFADLWDGDRWLASAAKPLISGTCSLTLPLPTPGDSPRLLWVEAYRDAYLPGQARAGRWLVSSADPTVGVAWGRAGLTTAGYPIGADTSPGGLRVDLGQLARPDRAPALLADSTDTARQSVGALKTQWQGKFVLALALSGLLVITILTGVLVRHQRELKTRWTLAGGDEDGEGPGRKRIAVDAGYLFLVLAIYLVGLIHLLQTIQW